MSEAVSTAASTPVTFVEGASLSAPVTKTRGSKYDSLLEAVLVKMLDAPEGEWHTWTLADAAAASRAALQVRKLGRDEGAGLFHFKARGQQDPNSAAGILFVLKSSGPAPTRSTKNTPETTTSAN